MRSRILLLAAVAVMAAACDGERRSYAVAIAVDATLTALAPVQTDTPLPTDTPQPSPTASAAPTATCTATPKPPTPTRTPAKTATIAPTATPSGPQVKYDEWSWYESGTGRYIHADGLVQNISNRPMEFVLVQISLRDTEMRYIASGEGYVEPLKLYPGDSGRWSIIADNWDDLEWVQIENITWKWAGPPTTPQVSAAPTLESTLTAPPIAPVTRAPTLVPTSAPTLVTLSVGQTGSMGNIDVTLVAVEQSDDAALATLCGNPPSPASPPFVLIRLSLLPHADVSDIALSNAIFPLLTGNYPFRVWDSQSCENASRRLVGQGKRQSFAAGQPIDYVLVMRPGAEFLYLPDGSRFAVR